MLSFLLNLCLLFHVTNSSFRHDPYFIGTDELQSQPQPQTPQRAQSSQAQDSSGAHSSRRPDGAQPYAPDAGVDDVARMTQTAHSPSTPSVQRSEEASQRHSSTGAPGTASDTARFLQSPYLPRLDGGSTGNSHGQSPPSLITGNSPTAGTLPLTPNAMPSLSAPLQTPTAATAAPFPADGSARASPYSPGFQQHLQQTQLLPSPDPLITSGAATSIPPFATASPTTPGESQDSQPIPVATPVHVSPMIPQRSQTTEISQFPQQRVRVQAFNPRARAFRPFSRRLRPTLPLSIQPLGQGVVAPTSIPTARVIDTRPFPVAHHQITPSVSLPPAVPTDQPLPLSEYVQKLPNAIVEKYKGRRMDLERNQNDTEKQLFHIYKVQRCEIVGQIPGLESPGSDYNVHDHHRDAFKQNLGFFQQFVFGYPVNTEANPHVLIQSDFIYLSANVNVYDAMNYILSPFCKEFDELSVVTVLKQLTMYANKNAQSRVVCQDCVQIVKAIWDRLFDKQDWQAQLLKKDVLSHEKKNIASYSLQTLAVHHKGYDAGILETLLKLSEEMISAKSFVTLGTYNCVIRRFLQLALGSDFGRIIVIVRKMWGGIKERLRGQSKSECKDWKSLMDRLCLRFRQLTNESQPVRGLANELEHDAQEFIRSL